MSETPHEEPIRPRGVEAENAPAQSFSFRLSELEFRSTPGDAKWLEGRTPDGRIERAPLQATIGCEASRAITAWGSSDQTFNPRFLAWLREIEDRPSTYSRHPRRPDVRLAYFAHRGIRWEVAFVLDLERDLLVIFRVSAAGPVIIAQDA